ncbi:MAG TPA: hypothetical protein VIN32_08810 [Candidatus Limnocylindria bacterium]|jgi:hypothetical protein
MFDDRRDRLEARLAELAAEVEFPATPPLVALVGERLAQAPPRIGLGRPVSRGLALAMAATVLLAGIAVAFGIGVGGLRLVFGPASFSPIPSMVVGPGLGAPTSLDAARGGVTFTLRVPGLPELGQPDRVYLADPPAGGAVTLLYGERSGFPTDPASGIGLIVTQFRADIGPDVFEKLIEGGVRVMPARVHGEPAWWVAGGDHFFFYRDAQGHIVDSTLRLASPTLIWEEGGVTYRVEGAPSLAEAARVAESLD